MNARSVVLVVILLGLPSPAFGQRVTTVPSEIACRGCRIVLEPIARLGGLDDADSPSSTSRVARDSRGRYYVAPTHSPGTIAMYDRMGRLVHAFGRPGRGPGEFGSIVGIDVGSGDTVHVFEPDRRSLLAPGLAGFVRVHRLPFPPRATQLVPDGVLLQYLDVGAGGRVRLPLHVIGAEGEVIRSFGGTGEPLETDQLRESVCVLGAANGGRVWSAYVNEYRVELWSREGAHVQTIERTADWFPPATGPAAGSVLTHRPHPAINALWHDGRNHLWVSMLVPARTWRAADPRQPGRVADVDWSSVYDTVIEVIDIRGGRVLARARFDRAMARVRGSGIFLFGTRSVEDGNLVIDVWRARLDGHH